MPPLQQINDARTLTERYIAAARDAGCPADQIRTLIQSGIVLQERQLLASAAARACDHDGGPTRVGYGGARGGGKSHWSVSQLVDDCLRYPGLTCLLLRKIGKKGKESFENLRQKVLRGVPHTYTATDGVRFPNGSHILLGHYQHEKNVDDYLGLEYDVIAVEESTTLSDAKLVNIRTCLRTSKPGWRPRIYETTNPGGVSHARFKKTYIDPWRKEEESDTRFVPATVKDNRFVNKEYLATLEALVGWQRDAWLHGNWDIASGQFFTNWRDAIHVWKLERDANGKTIPFVIPEGWRVWMALDYGFTHLTTAYILCKSNDGIIYIIAEHAARKKLPEWHALQIKSMLARHGLVLGDLYQFVAGADCFSITGDQGGLTIAQQYQQYGINLKKANIDRISGAGEILNRLGDVAEGQKPKLFVMEGCVRLIECIPSLVHDPLRPEDVDKVDCNDDTGEGGDDPYDGARYGVMAERSPRRIAVA